MDIREALIEEGVASGDEIARALARQVLYGGDLITNLLDLHALDERAAARALCRAYALAPAPPGELPYGAAAAIELLPRELASELGVYPYRLDGDTFTVIAGAPLDGARTQQLSDSLGVKIRVLVALAPRVEQALCRDYAQTLEPRTEKALARLEGRAPQNTLPASPLLEGPSFSRLPHAPSIPPVGFPQLWVEGETPTDAQLAAETAPAPPVLPRLRPARLSAEQLAAQRTRPVPVSPAPSAAPAAPAAPSPAPSARAKTGAPPAYVSRDRPLTVPAPQEAERGGRARRRGPYTARHAESDLREASFVEAMLGVYFDFAAQYFDRAALFTLHSGGAQMRDGRGVSLSAMEQSEHPLAEHPAIEDVARSGRWLLAPLSETDPKLFELLMQEPAKRAQGRDGRWLLLPVRVRGRVALILLGAFDGSDVALSDVGDLLAFEAIMSAALERAILARKRGRGGSAVSGAHAAVRADAGRSPAPSLLPKMAPDTSRAKRAAAEEQGPALAQAQPARPRREPD